MALSQGDLDVLYGKYLADVGGQTGSDPYSEAYRSAAKGRAAGSQIPGSKSYYDVLEGLSPSELGEARRYIAGSQQGTTTPSQTGYGGEPLLVAPYQDLESIRQQAEDIARGQARRETEAAEKGLEASIDILKQTGLSEAQALDAVVFAQQQALGEEQALGAFAGGLAGRQQQELAASQSGILSEYISALGTQEMGLRGELESLPGLQATREHELSQQMYQDELARLGMEAGLTGQYMGQPTLAAQEMEQSAAMAELAMLAEMTGQYKGQPTFAYQKYMSDLEQQDFLNYLAEKELGLSQTAYGQQAQAQETALVSDKQTNDAMMELFSIPYGESQSQLLASNQFRNKYPFADWMYIMNSLNITTPVAPYGGSQTQPPPPQYDMYGDF